MYSERARPLRIVALLGVSHWVRCNPHVSPLHLMVDLQFVKRLAFFHHRCHLLHHLVELGATGFGQTLDMCLLEELEFFKGDDSVASSDFQIELMTLLVVQLRCSRETEMNIRSVLVPLDLTHQTSRNGTSLGAKQSSPRWMGRSLADP